MDLASKQRELELLRQRAAQLEHELQEARLAELPWKPNAGYAAYSATTGFLLGALAAAAALLLNVIAAPVAGRHPLELIRVYLTFPLGEQALQLTDTARNVHAVDGGITLTFGCCLYLATGMLLGVPFQLVLAQFGGKSLLRRLVVGAGFGLLVWVVGFYGVLSWLQPRLYGGNWIVNPQYLPPWVAAATHLVFGLTMALLYPLGEFRPLTQPEKS